MALNCHSCAGATARYGGVETDECIKRGQSSINTVTSTTAAHPGGWKWKQLSNCGAVLSISMGSVTQSSYHTDKP